MDKKTVLIFLAVLVFCFFGSGCSVNPVTGKTQFNLYGGDIEDDVGLGQQWSGQLEKEFGGEYGNESVQRYVDHVGQIVAAASHAPHIEWHFTVLEHEMMNAFALPGGYVYITTGMLSKLKSESQLAGILAHESSHVTLRHSSVRMSEQVGLDILLSAALPSDTSAGVAQATGIVRQIVSLKYSRDDETQADSIGLDYLIAADYNPYGMVQTMQTLEDENEARPIEFLSSHPSPVNRIENLMILIENKRYDVSTMKTNEADYQKVVLSQLEDVKK